MSFIDLVKKRRSVRAYLDKPVEREKLERCIEAARLAPSAHNVQPWHFIVIDDPEVKDAVTRMTFDKLVFFNRFAVTAPVVVVIVSEPKNLIARFGGAVKDRQYHMIDLGIASEHFCLQAAEEGLGTCMLGWFDEKAIKNRLGIPGRKRINMVILAGYAAEDKNIPKKRKKTDQIKSYNSYRT